MHCVTYLLQHCFVRKRPGTRNTTHTEYVLYFYLKPPSAATSEAGASFHSLFRATCFFHDCFSLISSLSGYFGRLCRMLLLIFLSCSFTFYFILFRPASSFLLLLLFTAFKYPLRAVAPTPQTRWFLFGSSRPYEPLIGNRDFTQPLDAKPTTVSKNTS